MTPTTTAAPAPATLTPEAAALAILTLRRPLDAPRVVRVVTLTPQGTAARVVVRCAHPGCEAEREIATQDLFQVKHCTGHLTPASRRDADVVKAEAAAEALKLQTAKDEKAAKKAEAKAERERKAAARKAKAEGTTAWQPETPEQVG